MKTKIITKDQILEIIINLVKDQITKVNLAIITKAKIKKTQEKIVSLKNKVINNTENA